MRYTHAAALGLAYTLEISSAFTVPATSPKPLISSSSSSALFLKPDEADQLVAAFDASCQKLDDEDALISQIVADDDNEDSQQERPSGPTSAARALVGRLFKLPSEPHPEDDVVLYPVIGFTFVNHDGCFRALPKTTNASCRIVNQEEPVYGYYRAPTATTTPEDAAN